MRIRNVKLVGGVAGVALLLAVSGLLCAASITPTAEATVNTEETVRAKARKLLDEVLGLLQAYQAQDAVRLAKSLGAEPEAIRLISISQLGNLGLPAPMHKAYLHAVEAADKEALEKARKAVVEWAQGYRKKKRAAEDVEEEAPTKADAERVLWGTWIELIRYGSHGEQSAKELLLVKMGLREEFTDEPMRWAIAMSMLRLLDAYDLDQELGLQFQVRMSKDLTDKVLAVLSPWILKNLPYLYFHPVERTLKLDREARAHDSPSAEYRKTHPWNANEGPNLIDPKKKPEDIR
jgi:hypothetical protein